MFHYESLVLGQHRCDLLVALGFQVSYHSVIDLACEDIITKVNLWCCGVLVPEIIMIK